MSDIFFKIDHNKIDEDLTDFPVSFHVNSSNITQEDFNTLKGPERAKYMSGVVLEVGGGKTYSTITTAIAAANTGDLIAIYPGTYNETVSVDKQLHFRGMGSSPTDVLIQHSGASPGYIFGIMSNVDPGPWIDPFYKYITIENLHIYHTYAWRSGIVCMSGLTDVEIKVILNKCYVQGIPGNTYPLNINGQPITLECYNCTLKRGYSTILNYTNGKISFSKVECVEGFSYYQSNKVVDPDDKVTTTTSGYGYNYGVDYYGSDGEISLFNVVDENGDICPTEILYSDLGNREIYAYTKLPTVYSGIDTYFSLQPVTASGGWQTGGIASGLAAGVWDTDYLAVYHLQQDPSSGGACILDSTSNNNHGTPYGSMTGASLVTGPVITKALEFDGIDDYLAFPSLASSNEATISFMFSPKAAIANDKMTFIESDLVGDTSGHFEIAAYNCDGLLQSNSVGFYWNGNTLGSSYGVNWSQKTDWEIDQWYYLSFVVTGNKWKLYVNGELDSESVSDSNLFSGNPVYVGRQQSKNVTGSEFQGLMYDLTLSACDRSSAWVKASNYTMNNELVSRAFPTNCEGVVLYGNTTLPDITVNLYRRATGELIASQKTTISGTFSLGSPYTEDHFAVALASDSRWNAEVFDYLNPTTSGGA